MVNPQPITPIGLPGPATGKGLSAVTQDEFSFADAVGGIRGLIESVLPGLVFIVAFLVTGNLTPALIGATGVALVAVIVRLAQRTPISQAISGLLGIAIGVLWARRSGQAQDFFVFGLWQNAIYLVAVLLSLLVRWPLVGVVVELLRTSIGLQKEAAAQEAAARAAETYAPRDSAADQLAMPNEEPGGNPFAGAMAWRRDATALRRYTLATWLWVGLFAIRLAVQVPLYLHQSVGWLGTARLLLGAPLWAGTLYFTWAIIHRNRSARA